MANQRKIELKHVRVHNLKSVDLELDPNQLIVFTGVSGSGKSSLAFDTLYVEGQRRYIESLSNFAKKQMGEMAKPEMESADGITPTISIEQKTTGKNPRSTVGTLTEIYDYFRVLYARVATPYCPVSGEIVSPQSKERIIKVIQNMSEGCKITVFSPFAKDKKAEFKEDFQDLLRKGFMRARVDGEIINLNDEISLDGNIAHTVDLVIDRIAISAESHSRIAEAVIAALMQGNGVMSVYNHDTMEETLFSMHAYSPKSGLSYTSLEPNDFSFNSPSGMCPTCNGLGNVQQFNLELIIDENKSIQQDCCQIASSYQTVRYGNIYDNLARLYNFSVETPWKKLKAEAKKVFLYGTEKKWTRMHFLHPVTGASWSDHVQWRGVLHEALTRLNEATSESYKGRMKKLMHEEICPDCKGAKLKAYPASAKLGGKKIHELTAMTVKECKDFFDTLKLNSQELLIAKELLKEIRERLRFLLDVGLHYLALDRTAPTLSGGEAQRVRLASQIGCGLVGITYVLDEPSIGLHPRDNKKLIKTLLHLRDIGNTVIVVEHDEETILEADEIVDFGPGAGVEGGQIIAKGSLKDLFNSPDSLTSAYVFGKKEITTPKKRRKGENKFLEVLQAKHHNLKNINAKFPLGIFTAVTGVSGSGKSSLVLEILYPALANALHKADHKIGAHGGVKGIEHVDKVIAIDQSPIGRNPRSNPATYIKLFDEIRDLFAALPESLAKGFKAGRFSFNVKEGSCPECKGLGMLKIDMDFMEDEWVECPLCKNKRFDPETLSIYYKGKNIHDVLEMDVKEAFEHFRNIPYIAAKLETLMQVGLHYLKLGQSSTTLSGGEAQRVKLAKELVRPATGHTFYIFDEPTTGLHFHDIAHLLKVLHALVDKGNTVVVIEHNMDVVKTADWIIDIGPEGGNEGGTIVAAGTPEKIAKMNTPTGIFLEEKLSNRLQAQALEAVKKKKALKKNEAQKNEAQKKLLSIVVEGAEQNNLKHLDICIPREKMTVFTGPSGSGKSSLAFDTIYAEGQRRYVESLSAYARQFVEQMPKPQVGKVEGLSPAIAIEQKGHAGNPRSTVGTMTETYDYLRVLYARMGEAFCPETGEKIRAISQENVVEKILEWPEGEKFQVLAPIEIGKTDKFQDVLERYRRLGFLRIRLNGTFYELDQDEAIAFDRKRKNEFCLVIDRLKIDSTILNRLREAIEHASSIGKGKLIVARGSKDVPFNLSFSVESTGRSYPAITPHTFAFNTQEGMCPECLGLGVQYGANLVQNPFISSMTVEGLLKLLWGSSAKKSLMAVASNLLEPANISLDQSISSLKADQHKFFFNGDEPEAFKETTLKQRSLKLRWVGINTVFAKAGKAARSEIKEMIRPLLDEIDCFACLGARINPLARNVLIEGVSINNLCKMPISLSLQFIEAIKKKKIESKLLQEVVEELFSRLSFLNSIGLKYLSLDRKAPTLSGGEAQRIRLARQLGSGLTGVMYVLDEPTIGLHPRDNARLNEALAELRDLGNTLVLVEHDPMTIKHADYILDFGPGSGTLGGHVTAKGTYDEIIQNPDSLTGRYLSQKEAIPTPKKRREAHFGNIEIRRANAHNLKNINVEIPLSLLTGLTGVSGSGKSTLIEKVLIPALKKGVPFDDTVVLPHGEVSGLGQIDKFIVIDQNPVGQTSRSDISTYVEVFDKMRSFFSSLPAARTKGLEPKHFSANHRRGMCTACFGLGYKKVEMHFLPSIRIECEECRGLRLNPVSLEVQYKGKNLGQYLQSTIEEVRSIFADHPRITRVLDTLIAVGLGYLKLGQETQSLSGGEAQRIKLSRELAKRSTGKTLYLLDEPTTGLHPDDIKKLLQVLQKLVDKGNTMVIIEHNLDVIKTCDYLIDLGPEAGEYGGEIIAKGTPEAVAKNKKSWTGKFLKNY